MKPRQKSRTLLSITQSKAKMYEYDVPLDQHIPILRDPANLFSLTIGLLGDYAVLINSLDYQQVDFDTLKKDLVFSARFFDSFIQARFDKEIDPYLSLLGSATYYLSDLPGSSYVLAKQIERHQLNLNSLGLENLLLWILLGNYDENPSGIESIYYSEIQDIITYYKDYMLHGNSEKELILSIQNLRSIVYFDGTPRQLLLADVIGAIILEKHKNSTWTCLPDYTKISIDLWRPVLEQSSFTIRELWPAQHKLGQKGVFEGKSAIIQMPTSAGKTKATEIIIRSSFLSNKTSLAVIVAPFRALCHEIHDHLELAFKSENIFINELTDLLQPDYEIESLLDSKQIIIVTPEKLVYVLRHSQTMSERIGLIIYDEGHQFDNGIRGITYELLLTKLKENLPPNVQSVLISAVISNGDKIGEWLNGANSENITGTNLIPTYRSVAFSSWTESLGRLYYVNPININLQEYFVPRIIEQQKLLLRGKESKERYFPTKNDGEEIALYLGLKLVDKGSVAIFCGTKISVTNMCKTIVDAFSRNLKSKIPYDISNKEENDKQIFLIEKNLGADSIIARSAKIGIFSHHNNIPHGLRLAIEFALKEGFIKYVICTSTLAQGVNLPIRYLIVTSTYQGENKIKVRDFQNLIGRTGRAVYHTEGSILFSDTSVFDKHLKKSENWQWKIAKNLLNPNQLEPCDSTLLTLFTPIISNDRKISVKIGLIELVQNYLEGEKKIKEFIDHTYSDLKQDNYTYDSIEYQISWKIGIFSKIESFLLSHYDTKHHIMAESEIRDLAKGTLAFYLATDEEKGQLIELFVILNRNINNKVPDLQKRIIFGKTLFGLNDSIRISTWVSVNYVKLTNSNDDHDLLNVIWPILTENITLPSIIKCTSPDDYATFFL